MKFYTLTANRPSCSSQYMGSAADIARQIEDSATYDHMRFAEMFPYGPATIERAAEYACHVFDIAMTDITAKQLG